ncbi:head completion/stabilization protein [Erwiniaceae bacterium BAC15a-03b]|uniref:Head completion/stabilization protein n=1 Tax=Winslowiella arboricola TaxID=2978220 RepID=A0A9J6PHM4_9GAMM|nr:head completion/stabilization protein [Winslowiella arboricola]MCU5773080.1 head completion/stabilization protein [Winslowiella arboricola]MCU5777825.1 head completion/stabilization protein [Winslowiella arboricola]
MKFVAPEQAPETPQLIRNTSFWPDLDLADFRSAMRTDGTVTTGRLRQAVLTAISEVNAELFDFKARQLVLGFLRLADVPAEELDGESQRLQQYRRAVWCWTRANLNERYQDVDATGAGAKRGEALDDATDELWRDARWAISHLQDAPHSIVELI